MNKKPIFKNPAVKSMVSIALYLVIIIGVWIAIGALAFPSAARKTDVKAVVTANEPLITQLAEAAADDSLIEALTATDTVKELLEALHVSDIQAADGGAAFLIRQDSDPAGQTTRLLYYREGGYVFSPEDPASWTSVESSESAALCWANASGGTVEVSRLTDHFFLEITREG